MKNFKAKGKYDLFSKRITLYFRGSGYFSTLFGIIATAAYISFYFIFFVYYSFFGLLKKKGTFTSEKTITTELPNLTLSKNNLYFAYALEDPVTYDAFRDDEIYYTEAYYRHGKRTGDNWKWTQQKLEVGPCEIEYFGEKYQSLAKEKPYKFFTCIKNLNVNLFGNFVFDDYSFIYIKFFPCVNDTEHHCKSQEKIDQYLNGTFVDFQVQNSLVNYEDYYNPVIENIEDVYTTIGKGFKRDLHMYFQLINFNDYGFFGESLGIRKYIQYDYNNPMITLNSGFQKNKSICDVTIKLSDKTLVVKREYYTLMDIFSKIGGTMEFILKIITVISFFIVSAFFNINVINEVFQFHKKSKETLHNGIKNQNYFKVGAIDYCNKMQNSNSKTEFKSLKPIFERKINSENERKHSNKKLVNTTSKNMNTQSIPAYGFNSKDYILNNIVSNIPQAPQANNNIDDLNNNDIINELNKKHNFENKYNTNRKKSVNESKIIKILKINPFNLCLFSLFPKKYPNKKSILLKIAICKFKEELDITKLFRVNLLNSKAIEILKNNSSILSFNKEDLDINTYTLHIEE